MIPCLRHHTTINRYTGPKPFTIAFEEPPHDGGFKTRIDGAYPAEVRMGGRGHRWRICGAAWRRCAVRRKSKLFNRVARWQPSLTPSYWPSTFRAWLCTQFVAQPVRHADLRPSCPAED